MAALPGKTVALGSPQSPTHKIDPIQLADWMTEYEALSGSSGITYIDGTLADLNARTGVSEGEYGLVINENAEAGIYERASGTWSKVAGIPSIFTESLAADQAAASASAAANSASQAASSASAASASASSAESSALSAEQDAVNAATNAVAAVQGLISDDVDAAALSAASAASDADAAQAAAEASGDVLFYDNKAAANAALAGLSEGQVVEVFTDESKQNARTRYRVESSALVFKVYLVKARDVYVDSVGGSDSNDGLTPTTPLQTPGAADALAQEGSTIYLKRGSHWFNGGYSFVTKYTKIKTYGPGNRPIFDGGILVEGTWTQDGTYTNLWYQDVTLPQSTSGNYLTNPSSAWHPMMWDEADSSRTTEAGLIRVLNGDTVGGVTVSETTIAGLLTIADANAGSFTVHRTGSTNVEPRADNGTTYRFYIHPADGSNPNTNDRSVYVVGQTYTCNFGNGIDVEGVVFQRNGGKDMVGTWGGDDKVAEFVDCDFLEAGVHATVVGGAQFRRCVARAASHRDSYRFGGGAYHNYRGSGTAGTSKGFKIYDCEAHGFQQAIYSHGDSSGVDEHTTFDVDGFLAIGCGTVISRGLVTKGARARNVTAIDCVQTGLADFEDCVFINLFGPLTAVYSAGVEMKMTNCFVHKPFSAGRLEIFDPYGAGTLDPADYPIITFENCTIYGSIGDPGNAERRQQNWVLINSVLHQYVASGVNGRWLSGTITATNSYIGLNNIALEDIRLWSPNIDADCTSNWLVNKYEKVVEAGDLNYWNTNRSVSYGGTDNGDGTANLTINFNDRAYGRYIRAVDAYGAGLHYEGRVVSWGSTTSDPIVVTPPPTSAFGSKQFHSAVWGVKFFDPDFSETVTISTNGTQIRVADAGLYCVGMTIHCGRINKLAEDYGARTITAISGDVLTLDAACPWLVSGDTPGNFNSIDGTTTTNRQPLPTMTIGFGFPITSVNQDTQTWYRYPLVSFAGVEGTSGSAKMTDSVDKFNNPTGDYGPLSYNFSGRRTSGAGFSYGSNFCREGYIDTGFGVAVGDTITMQVYANIEERELKFASNPALSLDGSIAADSYVGELGIGFKKRSNKI